MTLHLATLPRPAERLCVWSQHIALRASAHLEFLDITERVEAAVRQSGVQHGLVNVQTRHTTGAIVVNENEPLLLEDLRERLVRFAPRGAHYRHDRLDLRTVNDAPGERPNGHSHTRALVLGASESLNVVDGALALGHWQRVFFVELDGIRERSVSLCVRGTAPEPGPPAPRAEALACGARS